MKIVTIDFETYWSQTHSLSKMLPMAYVMHPDTEIQSCSIKIGNGPTRCVFGEAKIKKLCAAIDWSDALVVAHNNAEFDAMILAWRLGVKPKMWGCTLAMARPIYTKTVGLSLAKLGEKLCPELGAKGSLDEVNTKGKHLAEFSPDELAKMEVYNNQDTELCYGVFQKLAAVTTPQELRLIDATIRMLVEPGFETDMELLRTALAEEQARKHATLLDVSAMVGVYDPGMSDEELVEAVSKVLSSAPKFKALLETLGIECPMKPSPSDPESGKMVPALAKTDEAFLALQEHDNPLVASAASARLCAKSTLLETRITKFLEVSELCDGMMPVPLRYAGADTTMRWSGWAYNPQNLPRVSGKPSDALRNSLKAPKGHKVVVADLSGIELRVNMFLWKVPYAMKLFRASPDKADLYRYFAANYLFNVAEDEITKPLRQVGKISHLGLGFGAGAPTFQKVAKIMGGIDMPLEPATPPSWALTEDGYYDAGYKAWKAQQQISAKEVVNIYRSGHPEIVQGWRTSHTALGYVHSGERFDIDPWGLCHTSAEGIVTPNGIIRYPGLHLEKNEQNKDEWIYGSGRHRARIYAGKVVENIVQKLARDVVAGNLLDIKSATGYLPKLTVHDELVYVAPDSEAEALLDTVQNTMRTPPKWWPELITWSEGDIADTYGAAK